MHDKRTMLSQVRMEKGWSMAELARRAGMQQGVISWIESGRFVPYPSQLQKLADALDWQDDPEELLEEAGNE